MAINNNFYVTMNSLVAQSTLGTKAVVDYASFMDMGKKASELSIEDLQNAFMSPLLKRIGMVFNDNPAYVGSLVDMVVAGSDVDSVIQTIMGTFYTATSNRGVTALENGTSYTDQFEYNGAEKTVIYHIKSNAKEFTISIIDERIRNAFKSVEDMNGFIASIFTDIANTMALYAEDERLAILASTIKNCLAETPATSPYKGAMLFNMVTLYNAIHETDLTSESCMSSDDYNRWVAGLISDQSRLMTKVSGKYNKHGADVKPFKTFTSKAYQRLKVNSIFDEKLRMSLSDAYHREGIGLPMDIDTEILPYWQNCDERMKINVGGEAELPTYSGDVVAVLYDKRRMMQVVEMSDATSAYQPRRRYTSYFWQLVTKAYENEYANAVVFVNA